MSRPSNTARNMGTRAARYLESLPSPRRDGSALRVCTRSVMLLPVTIPGMKSVSSHPATKTRRPGYAAARGAAAVAAATSRDVVSSCGYSKKAGENQTSSPRASASSATSVSRLTSLPTIRTAFACRSSRMISSSRRTTAMSSALRRVEMV